MRDRGRWEHWEHRHRPPPPIGHQHWGPPWGWNQQRRRGRLFLRFVGIFGLLLLLVVGGMAALAFVLSRLFGGGGQTAVLTWAGGCGLALTLPLLAGVLALRAFRTIAAPLADVMSAADAVAAGDLSARVPVPQHAPDTFTQLTESFNRMAEELELADQQRRNLTADVAHELRTPLHIIQGNLEGILDDVYQPTDDHVQATLEETRLLARLVEDLRTLSLAEAGQLPLHRTPVDVAELLSDVRTSFGGQAEAAGVDLRTEVEGERQERTIVADAGRLDQVLTNLVANGLRHTPPGGTITLRAEPRAGNLRITVTDTGEGIPPEDLPYVFDRFWRGDPARSRAAGVGSGLGLPIARQLVQAHGGRIDVESRPGEGTTFTIELPRE